MAPVKAVLLACGSFNPPTHMHLRMFEVARDNLNRLGQYVVVGGIISPVHDSYGKKDLVPSSYRSEMLKLALQSSDWIRVSNWECSQDKWIPTMQVLQYHQNVIDSVLNNDSNGTQNNNNNSNNNNKDSDIFNAENWLSNDIRNVEGPVQVKLLCGADLLQNFASSGLWTEADKEILLHNYGLIVVSRQGHDPYHLIYESDILTKYQNNIVIINEWVSNEISSTKIRRALRRQESVKYLIADSVIDFIKKNGLYKCPQNELKYNFESKINRGLNVPSINDFILTPSPSDVNMKSVKSPGDNVYLELTSFEGISRSISEPQKIKQNLEPSSSTILLHEGGESRLCEKFPEDISEDNGQMKFKKVGPNQDFIDVDTENITQSMKHSLSSLSAEKTPKRDKTDSQNSGTNIGKFKDTALMHSMADRLLNGSDINITMTQAKTPDFQVFAKVESDCVIQTCNRKSSLMLRRSNSDAIMSHRADNKETASVKIHFTKDGIQVISDKESIV